jgi:hypothetical protein
MGCALLSFEAHRRRKPLSPALLNRGPPRPLARLVGALKALEKSEKAAEDDGKPPRREAAEQRVALLEQLGWGHWAAYERARLPGRFPAAFPPI